MAEEKPVVTGEPGRIVILGEEKPAKGGWASSEFTGVLGVVITTLCTSMATGSDAVRIACVSSLGVVTSVYILSRTWIKGR